MFSDELTVGIAELIIAKNSEVLICPALGSCVAIILYEPDLKTGALAHIMLPDSREAKKNKNSAKFADTAIRVMIKTLVKKGAKKEKIIAKVIGGAHMFRAKNFSGDHIGLRNVTAVKVILGYEGIDVVSEDTGGNYGRTVKFYTTDGKVVVRSIKGEKSI